MLKFTVEGQKLELIGDPFVAADSFDYLTGEFRFYSGYDWDLTEKHVFFQLGEGTPYEVVLVDNKFIKTDHVNLTTGTWSIYVIGYDIDGATLVERITTNKASLTVDASGVQDGEPFPPSIIPDILVTVDQTTPQTFENGVPKLAADRLIENENDMVDAKFVNDSLPTIPDHNDSNGLQGGSAGEYYHITQAQNSALHAHSNKTALDAVSGTNTGDQDVSGAISTHNTDAGAHANLGIVDAGGYYDATTVEGALQEVAADVGSIQTDLYTYSPVNLFNKNDADILLSGFLNANNQIATSPLGWGETGYIPVTPGNYYNIGIAQTQYCFFNANKVFISGGFNPASVDYLFVPTGVYFIRVPFQIANIDTFMVTTGRTLQTHYIAYGAASQVSGLRLLANNNIDKRWNVLGDSYTFGQGTTKAYWRFICEKYGLIGVNYGVGGSSIGGATPNSYGAASMLSRYATMRDDADIITVMGGLNDWGVGCPMGNMADRISTSFYGALHLLCQGLLEKYPTQGIGFITQLHVTDAANSIGLKHSDYIAAIKEVCAFYSIPIFDLFDNSGISLNNATRFAALMNVDNVHPNLAGHTIMARKLEQWVLSL